MINYTITLSLLICAVILLRAVFRKRVPQRLIYALWLAVLIKMCLPFSFIALDIPALPGVYPNSVGSITAETTTVFETEIKDSSAVTNPQITEKPIVTAPPATVPNVTAEPVVTAPVVTAPPAVTAAPVVTAPAVSDEIKNPTSASPAETVITQSPPAPAEPKQNVFDLGKTLLVLSLLGSVAVGAFFGLSAIQFSAKLREDRVFLKKAGRVSVYVSQNALTPCVFGILPKIYVTPAAAESENLDLILRHELTHVRHGDNLWAVVRTAAIVIFWWNPLVWAAAMLSRRDAELACDEAVAAHLDRDGRSAYAHTIIDSIPQKRSHAPGLSGAPIKERLIMIMKKRKANVLCIVLALVLTLTAAGCSFIGSKDQTPDDTTKPSDTTEPDNTTEPSDNVSPEKESYFGTIIPNPIEFTFGEGVVEVSAFEGYGRIKTIEIDSEHILTSSYSYDSDTYTHINITVYIVNTKTGKIVHTEKLKDGAVPASAVKTIENGVIVNSFGYPDNGYSSWEIKRDGDSFTITEVPYNEDYYIELGIPDVLTSPDGKTKVYNIGPKDYVTVKTELGEEKTVLEPYLTESNMTAPVKGYAAVEFIDNDSFVYKIISGDQIYGYGVYNVKTGEKVEYENGFSPSAVYNGKVYGTLSKNYEFGDKIGILGEDVVHREISVPEKYAPIFENMKDSNNPERFPVFHEGKWFVFNVPNERVYVFSDDLSTMLSEIKLPWDRKFCDAYLSGNRMTVIFDKAIGPFEDSEETPTDPGVVSSYFGEVTDSPIEFVFGKEAAGVELSLLEGTGYGNRAKIDNEHYLFCTFERAETDIPEYVNITAYVVNIKTGKIVQTEHLEDGDVPGDKVKIMENGVVVNSFPNSDGEVTTSWEIKREGEKFTFTKVPYNRYYDMIDSIDEEFTSPDGKITVYNFDSHISVRDEEGVKRAVLQTHLTEPGNDLTVRGYTAIGFLDSDRFVYRIGGWEWTYGYGVYNVKTGEKVEYENGFSPSAVYNGKVYSTFNQSYEFGGKIEILDENGVHREISVPEQYASIIISPLFFEGKWIELKYNHENGKLSGIYVFSDDLSTLIAEIKLTEERGLSGIFLADGRITLVCYKQIKAVDKPDDTTTEPDNTPAEPPELSEELKLEIQKAYAEYHNKNNPDKPITQEDVFVFGYRGEYSGAHVITIHVSGYSYPALSDYITVNGEKIRYGSTPPHVYKDGEFYGVDSAFEKGILSAEDIKSLAD